MKRRALSLTGPFHPTLLPFLDLIVSLIGIFVVVLALQQLVERPVGRLAETDYLLVCRDGRSLDLYRQPHGQPHPFGILELEQLLTALGEAGRVQNLTFAFTAACFTLREAFARTFDTMARRREGPPLLRLDYRPLSAQIEALEELLETWRGQRSNG
ncbi:MAG: hypothetical protein R3310_13125 [Candidatus Competibacteraceae bacterium]|nr:hypothetical protein [Candidatus Competibacteraceae bacterium]